MKRLMLVLVAVISVSVYVLSSNVSLMAKIRDYRVQLNSPFADDHKYGNLYAMACLPQFGKDNWRRQDYPDTIKNIKRDINLHVVCNSYLYAFVNTDRIFYGVKRYWFSRNNFFDNPVVKLDTTQKNVLLIETTENSLGPFGGPEKMMKSVKVEFSKDSNDTIPSRFVNPNNYARLAPWPVLIFNRRLDEGLNFTLFNYTFLSPIRELKASFNQDVFNKVDPEVRLSPDGKHLFAAATLDTSTHSCTFKKLDDKRVNMMVTSFNKIYDHYRSLGFDEVYLTIIPNPVTIVAPQMGTYNNLIPRIQNHPDLRMPCIDIYSVFKKTKEPIFNPSDTHWNYNGFRMWVNEFNKALAKQ